MEYDQVIITSENTIGQRESLYNKSILNQYLGTSAGRARLAQSMVQPLRTRIDYQSIGRKVFLVEQLPTGALPIYTKDDDV